jgi:histidine triad (HIT) family protein
MNECKFCDIASGKKQDYVVWENENFIAFLDRTPAHDGHLLLIPKEHTDYFFDMSDEQYKNMFGIAKTLSAPLKEATGAKRIGIAVVGFDVSHAHLHLIPLYGPGELFDSSKFKKATDLQLKEVQNRLKPYFEKLSQK